MNSAGAATFVEGLPESRRAALLNLLTDEDPAVYWTVREKILSLGPEASRWLQSHTLSNDPALRRRAQEIIFYFERQKADNQFLGFCLRNGEEFDLEQASWMLAQTRYPCINIEGYRALMDHFARELTARIDPGDEPRQVLRAINDYLFKELGFQGNEENY